MNAINPIAIDAEHSCYAAVFFYSFLVKIPLI